jgi:elongation factor P
MSKASELTIGCYIKHKNKIWRLVSKAHVKPGKGGAYIQAVLKSTDGVKLEERFSTDDVVNKLMVTKRDYQFSYKENDTLFLIDTETYDSKEVNKSDIGQENFDLVLNFASDAVIISLEFADDDLINLTLPESILVEVELSDPVVKGQTAASSYKNAVLKNGLKIGVPPYVEAGDKIYINPYGEKGITFVSRA